MIRKPGKEWEINTTKKQTQPTDHRYHQQQPKFLILVVPCKNGDNVFSNMFGFLVLGPF